MFRRPAALLGALALLACVPGSVAPVPNAPFVPRCSALCLGLTPPRGQVVPIVTLERQGPNLLLPDWPRVAGSTWGGRDAAGGDIDEVWLRDTRVPGYDNVVQVADSGGITPNRLALHRQDARGAWALDGAARFADESQGQVLLETFARVSVTALADTVAVCAVTAAFDFDVEAVAAFRVPGTSEIPIGDVEQWGDRPATGPPPPLASPVTRHGAGEVGDPADIGCAGVTGPGGFPELHVCLVTTDGHLWHTIKRDGPLDHDVGDAFTPFADVEAQIGDIGTVTRVDCAARGGTLHLVAVAEQGGRQHVWHTLRLADGSWRASRQPDGTVAGADDVLAIVYGGAPIGVTIGEVAVGFCHEGVDQAQEPLLLIAWQMDQELPYVAWTPSPRAWWPTDPPRTYSPVSWLMPPGPAVAALRGLSIGERPFSADAAAAQGGR
ncbi:MAG TPA: hypothetical protein PKA50_02065 [Gemmatimonadales bacterium]|nr:hypothetical protein [Gemmatimonadales bacterium]